MPDDHPAASADADSPSPGGGRQRPPLALPALLACAMMGFMGFNAVIGLIARELGMGEFQVGLIVAVAGVGMMATSRLSGRLSDRIGRRPVIASGLIGYIVSFALMLAFLIWAMPAQRAGSLIVPATASFGVLLVLRLTLSVAFGAVVTSSQAYVADTTTSATRSKGMALLGLGQALGMVLGPGLAGITALWSLTAPIAAAVLLGIVALIVASARLAKRRPGASAQANVAMFDPRLRFAATVAFLSMCCVMSAQIVTGFFAQDRFSLPTGQAASLAGASLTAVGVALVLAQVLVTRFGWLPRTLVLRGAPISAAGFASALLVDAPWQMIAGYFVAGFGMGFVFPAFQAAAANSVAEHEQGAAAGTVGAASALGMVIGPLLASALYRGVGLTAPFVLSALMLVAMGVFAFVQPASARAARTTKAKTTTRSDTPLADPFREPDDEARSRARRLLDEARHGALSVLDPATGYPMTSRVAVTLDDAGRPAMLMSALAPHVASLHADSRCSLLVGEPGSGDPLAWPRITLIGRARPVPRDGAEHATLRTRFLTTHPKSALYIDFADFGFFVLETRRASLNAGFGRAYRLTPRDIAPQASNPSQPGT